MSILHRVATYVTRCKVSSFTYLSQRLKFATMAQKRGLLADSTSDFKSSECKIARCKSKLSTMSPSGEYRSTHEQTQSVCTVSHGQNTMMRSSCHCKDSVSITSSALQIVSSFSSLGDTTHSFNDPHHYVTPLRGETVPRRIQKCEYAVRGPILNKAYEIMEDLKVNPAKYPFKTVLRCNLGNPQEVGQPPLSYLRHSLTGYLCPELLKKQVFPKDVVRRVEGFLQGSVPGAYSNSQGIFEFRQMCAHFFEERDKISTDAKDIFLTDGASEGIQMVINSLIRKPSDAIMVPVPQYPLYGATITLYDGYCADYYLDETKNWGCSREILEESYERALRNKAEVRAMVVINPGNPTGALMTKKSLQEIVKFCMDKQIALLADEVYQANIYGPNKFISMRRVAHEMKSPIQIFSYHSASKGLHGECGLRGGVMHMTNVCDEACKMLYKYSSVSLCANTTGQAAMALVVTPPKPGEESFSLYTEERTKVFDSLKKKAAKMAEALRKMEGVSCCNIEASLYAFPRITIPLKAIEKAKEMGIEADLLYCYELLDATGIVVVPGSGFGQQAGTFHYRTTILPQEEEMIAAIDSMTVFHKNFLEKYGGL